MWCCCVFVPYARCLWSVPVACARSSSFVRCCVGGLACVASCFHHLNCSLLLRQHSRARQHTTGEYLKIKGQYIHPEHYQCEVCHKQFQGGDCREYEVCFFFFSSFCVLIGLFVCSLVGLVSCSQARGGWRVSLLVVRVCVCACVCFARLMPLKHKHRANSTASKTICAC